MAKYRLAAHKYEINADGMVLTELFSTKAVVTVEADSFATLEAKITEFGTAHAPTNVWVTCQSKPKPRGFDKWNDSATKFLFKEPATV